MNWEEGEGWRGGEGSYESGNEQGVKLAGGEQQQPIGAGNWVVVTTVGSSLGKWVVGTTGGNSLV